jgi:hypothetical protein
VALSQRNKALNSQAFAAFGTTRVDHGASSAGFHAHQKTMGASAACFRGLVCAFHLKSLNASRKPCIIPEMKGFTQSFFMQCMNKLGFVRGFFFICG